MSDVFRINNHVRDAISEFECGLHDLNDTDLFLAFRQLAEAAKDKCDILKHCGQVNEAVCA